MDNLELIKQFLLRKQDLLILIKPIALILLLNETKKDLEIINYDLNNFRIKKNNITHGGDDFVRGLAEFLRENYELNITQTEEIAEASNLLIKKLNLQLNFFDNFPIKEEKLADERRKQIEWIFDLASTKSEYFKKKFFEILKNLIFGELIRINNQKYQELMNRVQTIIKHLRDCKISLNQLNIPKYNVESSENVNQEKSARVDLKKELLTHHSLPIDKVISLKSLFSWYQIEDNLEQGIGELEAKINAKIVSSEKDIIFVRNQNNFYLNLISDFEENSETWKKGWIDLKLPEESYF